MWCHTPLQTKHPRLKRWSREPWLKTFWKVKLKRLNLDQDWLNLNRLNWHRMNQTQTQNIYHITHNQIYSSITFYLLYFWYFQLFTLVFIVHQSISLYFFNKNSQITITFYFDIDIISIMFRKIVWFWLNIIETINHKKAYCKEGERHVKLLGLTG